MPRNGKFISLNSNVTASSTYGNDEDKYGAQFATDGGMQTRWAAADTVATLSLTLDEKEPFNKISIFEYCDVKNGAGRFLQLQNEPHQGLSDRNMERREVGNYLPFGCPHGRL